VAPLVSWETGIHGGTLVLEEPTGIIIYRTAFQTLVRTRIIERGKNREVRLRRFFKSASFAGFAFCTALPYSEGVRVARASRYARRVAKLLPLDEQLAMELHIAQNPEAHPVVPGAGGIRKARWGRPGQGKRGGVRTIYYFAAAVGTLYLLDVYAKNQQSDLTPDDKKELKRIVEGLR
jgi:hypothetical protein